MSQYYNPKRTYGLFQPGQKEPFKLSRSKIDLFLDCPRCFYLDRRLGTSRPPGYPFTLNAAVDKLLKKEFDLHRAKAEPHPLMKAYGLKAVPFSHDKMGDWRNPFVGIQYLDKASNFLVFGAIDDVWQNENQELIIVDYKATAKEGEINLDADWQIGYKRQMEIYQWLFQQNGFRVSDTGYFVYVNGKTDREAFDGKLEFEVNLIPYQGNNNWVGQTLVKARQCLESNKLPLAAAECDFCQYREAVKEAIKQ